MERCQEIFRNEGYKLTVYSEDNYSFYHCMNMAVLDNKQDVTLKKAMQKQNDLFEFEMKNPLYHTCFYHNVLNATGSFPQEIACHTILKLFKKGKSHQHQGKYLLQPKCYSDAFVLSVSTMMLGGTLKD